MDITDKCGDRQVFDKWAEIREPGGKKEINTPHTLAQDHAGVSGALR